MTTVQLSNLVRRDRPSRILVVEDERLIAREIEMSLTELGYRVVGHAASGADAVAKAESLAPDLVLMDIRMPGAMDGIEAAAAIQRSRPVPVVFLTAFSDPETLGRAIQTSPFGYLVKPFKDSELTCAIEVALQKSEKERAARARESAFRASLDALEEAIAVTDAETRITFVNRAAEILATRRASELIGLTLDDALHLLRDGSDEPVRWPLDEAMRERAARYLPGPVQLQRPAPDPLPVEAVIAPVLDEAGTAIGGVAVFRDLRGRIAREERVVRLEAETRVLGERADRSEQRFRALLDSATDGVLIVSTDGRVIDCNRRVEEIHGQNREDLVGRRITKLVVPAMMERARDNFARVFDEGFVRADGFEIQRPDRQRRVVDFSGCLVPYGEGMVVLALERDVTDEQRLEAQNRQLQKLEAVGQLTGGVAHDFNNILGVILANSEFLLESLAHDDPRHQDAEEIRRAGESGAALTRQLLAFSRKQVLEPAPLDLNSVVGGLEKMLRRVIGEDIDFVVRPGEALGTVVADRGQIEQVLMNLVVNARDAMPEGGELRIETADVEIDDAYALTHPPVNPGSYVMLAVSDTGVGMDEETRRRAFEPFFTTKERGRGTGLGLSTCYGIVKQSGGTIWIYSEPGRGTVFKIYLPRHDAPARPLTASHDFSSLEGSESVLLIEDNDSIRAAIRRALVERGYRVLAARNAAEATAAAEDSVRFDLILSDMVIPGGSGPDIAVELANRWGGRLLFMSGYTDHALLRSGALPEGMKFLQKPFTPTALLRKVREVLDQTKAV